MARFHQYSFGNVMLIALQKPEATKVAGFRTWKTLGRFVKKGEKGIVIIAPMMIMPKEQDGSDKPDSQDEARPLLRFKTVYVFDVSQTDGEPLPEFARVGGNPNGHTERLKVLVTTKGIALEYADSLGGPDGLSCIGTIRLRNGLTPAEEFSVLTHELAHEILHQSDRRKETTKTIRETEAESVAFVVCQAIGLETGTAAADYIRLYNGDADTLAESLDHIQKTAAAILAAIMNESAGDDQ
jgi:antirestriction protein ArdC